MKRADPLGGGRAQRVRSLAPTENRLPPSHTVNDLLDKWSWGEASAPDVQRGCKTAYDDQKTLLASVGLSQDFAHADLKHLAGIGSEGKQPRNCHSQLLTFLGEPDAPPATILKIQMKSRKSTADVSTTVIDVPVCLPHVVFSHYWHKNRERFHELFTSDAPTDADRESFWRELIRRGDPRATTHPIRKRGKGWARKAVPLSVHGDAVPVIKAGKTGTRSLDAYSMAGVLAHGPTIRTKQLLFAMFTDQFDDETMEQIWVRICWSFHWLYMGEWPRVDWDMNDWTDDNADARDMAGEPLADGMCGVILCLKGDLDHVAKSWKLRNYNANLMCDFCPCNRNEDDRGMLYNHVHRIRNGQTCNTPQKNGENYMMTSVYTGCFCWWASRT